MYGLAAGGVKLLVNRTQLDEARQALDELAKKDTDRLD
jgi:hypothetical protein